ncbi:hypothetical protein BM451_00250, partial [Dickeya dadantii]
FFTSQTNIFETRFFANNDRICFRGRIANGKLHTIKMLTLIVTIHVRKITIRPISTKSYFFYNVFNYFKKILIRRHYIKIAYYDLI